MLFVKNQNGNIFFTLFGAVAIVGLLGTVIVSTMRGPLTTMVEVQARAQAESEMAIASRLALLEATELASGGDCDGDGFVEPLEYADAGAADAPTGGGFLPNAVASSKVDPWGVKYGYCSWDAGGTTGTIACDTSGNGTNERLDGNGSLTDETYTIIAVISAGPDQLFGTTCTGGATPSIAKTGDDIVVEYTYATATAATGGLWSLSDPTTAAISKDIDVTGGATFSAGIDLTSSSAALQLGAASMLFPNETTLATCNAANDGLVRINTASDPDILQLCDDPNGWVSAGGAGLWVSGTGDDIYYNTGTPQVGIGTTTPAQALDVVGNIVATGNITAGGNLSSVDLAASGDGTIGGTLGVTGATTLSSTLAVTGNTTIGGTLGATGATTLSNTLDVTGASTLTTLNATGAVDFDSSLNVDGASTLIGAIDAQGTIANSTGDVAIGDNISVTGTADMQGAISNSTGNVAINDNVDITGTLTATVDVNAVDITASGDLTAGGTVMVNGDQLGPALACTSVQKLEWSDGTGWSCVADLQGGSGGGVPNLDDLADVTVPTPADGECLTYDNASGDWVNAACVSGSGAGIFEIVTNVARVKSTAGSYLDDDFIFGSPQLDDAGNSDHDTRLFFDKSKAAFRVGSVSGSEWNDANIGISSTAIGLDITASGNYSFGLGLGDATGTSPQISGASSFGVFMGDQAGATLSDSNTVSFMGASGGFGIGTLTPATALDVGGTVKIADGGETCAVGVAGAMRYNTNTIDFCDGTSWTTLAASGGGGASLSDLTAADATNIIANANLAQVWNWDTLTTETAMTLGSTSVTAGKLLDINSSATAFTGTMADITLSGSNAANTGTVLKSSVTGALSAAVPMMITNLGTGASFRVNDETGDSDATPFIIDAAGQVGISTATPATALDVDGTVKIADGGEACAVGVAGAMRYNTNTIDFCDGTNWETLASTGTGGLWSAGSGDDIYYNTGTFQVGIGTATPSEALDIAGGNINIDNTTFANQNGIIYKNGTIFMHDFNYGNNGIVTTIGQNTFLGINAGNLTMGSTATGGWNSSQNTAVGYNALRANTAGFSNTVIGVDSMRYNTTGASNTAIGRDALLSNITGAFNVAIGRNALRETETALSSVAIGVDAARENTTGSAIAIGRNALRDNTTGSSNVGVGDSAGRYITNRRNTLIGDGAGRGVSANSDISGNAILGYRAGYALQTGADYNILLGYQAGDSITTGARNIIIGNDVDTPTATTSDHLNIGNTIYGNLTTDNIGIGVVTPATALDVDGTVKIADGGEACAVGVAGAMRYNTNTIDFCDGTNWTTLAASGGGGASLSDLTAADATNIIANANLAQVWNWDTLTTETAMTLGSTSVTAGKLLDINSSATAFTGTMADITLSGSNAANTGTVLKSSVTGALSAAVPMMITNLGTGASFRVNDETGDSDATPFIIDAAGQVGISTATPATALDVGGTVKIANGGEACAVGVAGAMRYNTNTIDFCDGTNWETLSTISGGGGLWSAGSGDDIYYNTGTFQVGIGTATPSEALDIAGGNINIDNTTFANQNGIIYKNGTIFMHNFNYGDNGTVTTQGQNTFIGINAGNLTMGSTATGGWNSSQNTGIGENALRSLTTGYSNTAIGMDSMRFNTTGYSNTALGREALRANIGGAFNVSLGRASLRSNTTGTSNIAIGVDTSRENTTGINNVAIGRNSLRSNTISSENTSIGGNTGRYITNRRNTFVGNNAGQGVSGSSNVEGNVAFGYRSGYVLQTGADYNTLLGYQAGDNITTGARNIVIGYNTDASSATTSDQLNIGNTIYGDLVNNYIGIGIAAPNVSLDVNGDIEYTGTITGVSDRRLKDNIKPLGKVADKISKIDTYSFTMKDDENHRIQLGVMAQELEKIFPELVHTANDEMGTKSVNYVGLIAPLIEANKALAAKIETLKTTQASSANAISELSRQVTLLNKIVGSDSGKKASMHSYVMLLIGLLAGVLGGVVTFLLMARRRSIS